MQHYLVIKAFIFQLLFDRHSLYGTFHDGTARFILVNYI